jgi:site-specific DNA recombinase
MEASMEHRNNNAPIHYAVYARCASTLACQPSIEDQINTCTSAVAERNPHWRLVEDAIFTDMGVSGLRSTGRPALEALLQRAREQPKPFDCVVMTSTHRLGRHLPDVLPTIDSLKSFGINLYFVDQKLDSTEPNFRHMISFRHVIGEQFVERLRQKVRQGTLGRVHSGFSTGGRCYGYASVPVWSEDGSRIVPSEAAVVQQIYGDFALGLSAPAIARALNKAQVPAPRGSRRHRNGDPCWQTRHICSILRCHRYKGEMVWGRTQMVRNPETGKLERHQAPVDEMVRVAAPQLRIVDADLAKSVQKRLAAMSGTAECDESSIDNSGAMPDVSSDKE